MGSCSSIDSSPSSRHVEASSPKNIPPPSLQPPPSRLSDDADAEAKSGCQTFLIAHSDDYDDVVSNRVEIHFVNGDAFQEDDDDDEIGTHLRDDVSKQLCAADRTATFSAAFPEDDDPTATTTEEAPHVFLNYALSSSELQMSGGGDNDITKWRAHHAARLSTGSTSDSSMTTPRRGLQPHHRPSNPSTSVFVSVGEFNVPSPSQQRQQQHSSSSWNHSFQRAVAWGSSNSEVIAATVVNTTVSSQQQRRSPFQSRDDEGGSMRNGASQQRERVHFKADVEMLFDGVSDVGFEESDETGTKRAATAAIAAVSDYLQHHRHDHRSSSCEAPPLAPSQPCAMTVAAISNQSLTIAVTSEHSDLLLTAFTSGGGGDYVSSSNVENTSFSLFSSSMNSVGGGDGGLSSHRHHRILVPLHSTGSHGQQLARPRTPMRKEGTEGEKE